MTEKYKLDLTSLRNSINSLGVALTEYNKNRENLFVRDASIQRFEYTYELAHKMLKRFLEMTEANREDIDQMSFPSLIRTGAEKGLLKNSWDVWSSYRTARNLTSHTYNAAKAEEVFKIIPSFLAEAAFLMAQLEKRSEL